MWSNDASSRKPDLISVLFELHKPKLLGLFTFVRWYITSSFKVLCQTLLEKIDLSIMKQAAAAFARVAREGCEDSGVNDLSLRQLSNIRKFKSVNVVKFVYYIFAVNS